MKLRKSRLYVSLFVTTALSCLAGQAYAASGSITYDMEYVSQFGGNGTGNGQFSFPQQIAIGPDNNLYVADYSLNNVQVFNKSGTYMTQFATGNNPGGIVFTSDGKIGVTSGAGLSFYDATTYAHINDVADSGYFLSTNGSHIYAADFNNSVNIYDNAGNLVSTFAASAQPISAAINSAHMIYVSNYGAGTVSIYDSSGNFVRNLVTGMSSPFNLTIDAEDNVYLVDGGDDLLKVYDKNDNLLLNYDNSAAPTNGFSGPRSVAVDNSGNVFVDELGNEAVNILQLTSTETFSSSPSGGDETASTPLSNLVLTGTGGTFTHNFIGYNIATIDQPWVLSGTSSFTDYVSVVPGGILTNDGTINAPFVFVANTGQISGTGTYNAFIGSNGTISPGDNNGADIGTMTFSQYQSSSSSGYLVNVNAAGQSDKLVITGAASLGGDFVIINAASGTYHVATSYVILSAAGGVTGTFGSVTDNLAFLDPTLDYSNPDEVILTLTRNDGINPFPNGVDFTPYAGNGNASVIVPALSSYSMTQFNGDTATSNTVQGLSVADASKLLNEVSPDKIAALPQMQVGMIHNMQTPLFQRLQSAPSLDSQQSFGFVSPESSPSGITPDQAWVQTIGGVDNQDSSSNGAAGYRLGTVGVRAGADKDLSTKQKLGLSFAYAHGTANYKGSDDSSQTQYVHADVYGRQQLQKNFVLEGFAGVGGGRMDSTRYITAGGLNNEIIGNTNAYDVSGAVKLSKPIRMNNNGDIVTPNITGSASWTRQNGFTENGASAFNLHMDSITATPITITPMMNWQHTIKNEKYGYNLTPDLGIGATWQLTDLSDNVNANFVQATNTPGFTVTGAKQAPISLNFSAAITMQPFTSNKYIPTLTAQATQQTSNTTTNSTATLTAKWEW